MLLARVDLDLEVDAVVFDQLIALIEQILDRNEIRDATVQALCAELEGAKRPIELRWHRISAEREWNQAERDRCVDCPMADVVVFAAVEKHAKRVAGALELDSPQDSAELEWLRKLVLQLVHICERKTGRRFLHLHRELRLLSS